MIPENLLEEKIMFTEKQAVCLSEVQVLSAGASCSATVWRLSNIKAPKAALARHETQ